MATPAAAAASTWQLGIAFAVGIAFGLIGAWALVRLYLWCMGRAADKARREAEDEARAQTARDRNPRLEYDGTRHVQVHRHAAPSKESPQ